MTCAVWDNTSYNQTELIIPEKIIVNNQEYTVTSMFEKAFKGNNSIRKVTLPSTLTLCGYDAFSGCKNLEYVNFNNGIEVIADNLFKDCSKLKLVEGLSNVKTIYNGAFQNCDLELVSFNKLESIGGYNFFNNPSLKKVEINGSFNTLPGSSFELCPSLEEVVLPSSCTTIGE